MWRGGADGGGDGRAQRLLDEGLETAEVARRLEILPDTLSKAVRAGRLHSAKKRPGYRAEQQEFTQRGGWRGGDGDGGVRGRGADGGQPGAPPGQAPPH